MTLPAHIRRNTILAHEGQLLSMCQASGADMAADVARCVADGALNALIRIEGAEAASLFAFGLADRVAGGVKGPTAVFAVAATETAAEAAPELAEPAAEGPGEDDDAVEAAIVAIVDQRLAEREPRDVSAIMYLLGVSLAFLVGLIIGGVWR